MLQQFVSLYLFAGVVLTFKLAVKPDLEILKSPNDKLEYKYMKLKNELKVMLIRDKDTRKSSIAMNVAVGSMHNPKDLQGLAHILEHMLFMGCVSRHFNR